MGVVYAEDFEREQNGLVIDPSGKVLTVFPHLATVADVFVDLPGKGIVKAEVSRFDPRTGAALLNIEADSLIAAPMTLARIQPGQPVLTLAREDGVVRATEAYSSPITNAPDDLFTLFGVNESPGTVVVTRDGALVGLTAGGRPWVGAQYISGGSARSARRISGVLTESAMSLLDGEPKGAEHIPIGVAYHGPGWGSLIDGPLTRELVAQPVRDVLDNLGQPVAVEGLGGRIGQIVGHSPSTVLELIFASHRELRSQDGELLGSSRYVVLWWDRGEGLPDLVLCGDDPEHVGAAFASEGLASLAPILDQAPPGGRATIANPV
ncbi:MAG: hypothetical protein ACRD1H_04195, partial [Vicinamibacterales bacterium]